MRNIFLTATLIIFFAARAGAEPASFSLSDAIDYALANNPRLKSASLSIDAEGEGVRMAEGAAQPKLDAQASATRSRYDQAHFPISSIPTMGRLSDFPDFVNPAYDAGLSFSLPLYTGGRLTRNISIANLRKDIASESFNVSRDDLVFNVVSVFYKILQLDKLKKTNDAAVAELESHIRDATLLFKSGSAPKLDLLKTDVQLAKARQAVIVTENNRRSAYELLKSLMGYNLKSSGDITVTERTGETLTWPPLQSAVGVALEKRGDLVAAAYKAQLAQEKIRAAHGKHMPSVYLTADYGGRTGDTMDFKENWNTALKMSVPILDGGSISAEVAQENFNLHKAMEDHRALKTDIVREVNDAWINIDTAEKKIQVAGSAIESAREALRVEHVRYKSGAGTTTEVLDANSALLGAETDFYQATYDKYTAVAQLRKSMGETPYAKETGK